MGCSAVRCLVLKISLCYERTEESHQKVICHFFNNLEKIRAQVVVLQSRVLFMFEILLDTHPRIRQFCWKSK